MDSNVSPDPIPQFRELRKPYFLYRTPDNLGSYLQREVYRALFARKDLLTRFLAPAQLSGPQVKPPKVEYDFEGRAATEFVRMKYLSRAEIAAFKSAAEEFLRKADPNAAEKITPHERELRLHFRLPDPKEEPDAFWLHGPPNDRKLFILWGCEFRQNTSLPLMPAKGVAAGASLLERLEACATPWHGLQAQALELAQKNKEPIAEFIAQPVLDAKGQIKAVMVAGKSIPADQISISRYLPKKDIGRLARAARDFYEKAYPENATTSAYEKELRAALRFPDPSKKPDAYVMIKTAAGRRMHVVISGQETIEQTAPVVADDTLGLPGNEIGADGTSFTSTPVVDQLKHRIQPTGRIVGIGLAAAVLLFAGLWFSGVLKPKTPPQLVDATAENTPYEVRARFSKSIDPTSFYSADEKAAKEKPSSITPRRNFTLKDADGERVEIKGITAAATDPKLLKLATASRLDDKKSYTLSVVGVADSLGNRIASEASTPVKYLDTQPPKVLGKPSADGSDARKLVLKFDEELDARYSEIPANFSIPGFVITSAKVQADEPDTIVITANTPFKSGERYTLTLSGVTDKAYRPNSIREAVKLEEFPYIDTIPPKLQEIRAEKTQVEIEVVFSEPVQKGAAETPGNYVVTRAGQPEFTAKSARLLDDKRTVQLRTPALENGKAYVMKALNIQDLATPPNKLADDTAVPFNYKGKPDLDPPIIDGDIAVRGDGLRLTVAFNEPLDPTVAADANHFRLDDPTIKIVQVATKLNDPKAVILTPDQALQETKSYRLTVSGLADLVGNVVKEQTSKTFSGPGLSISQVDVIGISTIETTPDGKTITVTFTDEVDATSAKAKANYVLSENILVTEVAFEERNFKQVQLKLGTKLGPQKYTLTVRNLGLRSDPARVQREIKQGVNGPGARGI
jgi:hypothetical protein